MHGRYEYPKVYGEDANAIRNDSEALLLRRAKTFSHSCMLYSFEERPCCDWSSITWLDFRAILTGICDGHILDFQAAKVMAD